jgi:hypothetical protein
VGHVPNAAVCLTSKRFKNPRADGASIAGLENLPAKYTKRGRATAPTFFVCGVSILNSVLSGFLTDPKSLLFQRTEEIE